MKKHTISELIQQSTLDKLDTKLILRHVLNFTPTQLIMQHERELNQAELELYQSYYAQLHSGVPVNYVIGYREFYSRNFYVTPDTLIPRPETELMVDKIIELAESKMSLLDLGTGSGVIGITAKLECPELRVTCVDKFQATLDIARKNALNLGAQIDLFLSDWYTNVSGRFDVIVSNPPYIASNDRHLNNLTYEPKAALTDYNNGLAHILHIINQAHAYLTKNGTMLIEHGYDQGKAVREIYYNAQFTNIETLKDYAGLDRLTIATLG